MRRVQVTQCLAAAAHVRSCGTRPRPRPRPSDAPLSLLHPRSQSSFYYYFGFVGPNHRARRHGGVRSAGRFRGGATRCARGLQVASESSRRALGASACSHSIFVRTIRMSTAAASRRPAIRPAAAAALRGRKRRQRGSDRDAGAVWAGHVGHAAAGCEVGGDAGRVFGPAGRFASEGGGLLLVDSDEMGNEAYVPAIGRGALDVCNGSKQLMLWDELGDELGDVPVSVEPCDTSPVSKRRAIEKTRLASTPEHQAHPYTAIMNRKVLAGISCRTFG